MVSETGEAAWMTSVLNSGDHFVCFRIEIKMKGQSGRECHRVDRHTVARYEYYLVYTDVCACVCVCVRPNPTLVGDVCHCAQQAFVTINHGNQSYSIFSVRVAYTI